MCTLQITEIPIVYALTKIGKKWAKCQKWPEIQTLNMLTKNGQIWPMRHTHTHKQTQTPKYTLK